MKLNRFDNILIDLDDVRLLVGHVAIFKDGTMHDIGVKAADAMRSMLKPTEERLSESIQELRGKEKSHSPSSSRASSHSRASHCPKAKA